MAPMSLPPGFRFHPTDEELVAYYLDRKISGRTIDLEIIPEVDLYKCEPWDLPEKSFLPSKDMEWYFYSRRDKKYPNGSRTNRATRGGYWKATGKDREVVQSQKKAVGMKKTLVYYKGRAPHGIRTNWVMHEYRLLHSSSPAQLHPPSSLKDCYALCRVFKKSIQIPKKKDEKTEEDYIEKELGSGDEISERQLQVKDDDDDDDDMELQINFMMNEAEFHGVSKSDVTCSDSDVTQGGSTPNQTPFHHQTSSHDHLITTTTAPFTSVVDEANSSCTVHHHHQNYSNLQSYFPLSSSSSSIFQEDLEMSSYTASLNYQAPYPPLEFDDFPQINSNIFSASSSSETTKPTAESNADVNTPIDDFINMYDHHNKCKAGGQNVINGDLEDIFSLCSSSSHETNNPISLSMQD